MGIWVRKRSYWSFTLAQIRIQEPWKVTFVVITDFCFLRTAFRVASERHVLYAALVGADDFPSGARESCIMANFLLKMASIMNNNHPSWFCILRVWSITTIYRAIFQSELWIRREQYNSVAPTFAIIWWLTWLCIIVCLQLESLYDIGEGELKSLLDEAYNFRSPKDREGKSDLFQVSLVPFSLSL